MKKTKLTEEQVSQVKLRLSYGETQMNIAAMFLVNSRVIHDIHSGRTRKDIPIAPFLRMTTPRDKAESVDLSLRIEMKRT